MEGYGPTSLCQMCKEHDAILRCVDCTCSQLLCPACCTAAHKSMPFHRLEKWSWKFFERTNLTAQGFILYLGHGGDPCESISNDTFGPSSSSQKGLDSVVVVDVLGVHNMSVSWCQCENNNAKHIQLFHAKLFPTTIKRPSSAFTFQVLDYFHIDSVECKASAMTFYTKLRRLTDYVSPEDVPVRALRPSLNCLAINITKLGPIP